MRLEDNLALRQPTAGRCYYGSDDDLAAALARRAWLQ